MKKTLQKALHEGGKILLDNFGHLTGYEIKESQSSIVTQTDIDSENKIMSIIHEAFPKHNTLGEETGFQNRKSNYTWIVDPIDGTSNFAAGLPWFGVIIAVLKDKLPVMAGCYLPVQKELYYAEKGKGASLNGIPISVSSEKELKNVLAVYSLDYSAEPGKTEQETRLIKRLVNHVRNLRSTNSVLDFCFLASGKVGACINQTTKIWDIAGPALLIEEAGGKVSDLKGNDFDFTLNDTNYGRNFEIVATNGILHPKVMTVVKESMRLI